MPSNSIRLFGKITRLLPTGTLSVPVTVKVSKQLPTIFVQQKRMWNHKIGSNSQQVPVTASQPSYQQTPGEYLYSITELDYKCDEMKVFQDEQIIQLTFKSGETINYTMNWLRNLCSCPKCMSDRVGAHFQNQTLKRATTSEEKLNVSRIKSLSEEEFEIEWIDDDYRSHISQYNIKYLAMFQKGGQ